MKFEKKYYVLMEIYDKCGFLWTNYISIHKIKSQNQTNKYLYIRILKKNKLIETRQINSCMDIRLTEKGYEIIKKIKEILEIEGINFS